MRSIEEVLDHIEMLMHKSIERPRMYASSPEGLEDILFRLDWIRSFIHGVDFHSSDRGYGGFLNSRDLGSSDFSGRNFPPTPPREKDFALFAAFWQEYLQSDFYSRVGNEP